VMIILFKFGKWLIICILGILGLMIRIWIFKILLFFFTVFYFIVMIIDKFFKFFYIYLKHCNVKKNIFFSN
jgi:hypothetical protein